MNDAWTRAGIDFLPCICGEDAQLFFDGGWIFSCYECGVTSRPVFSHKAARKEFRLLVARLEGEDDEE